MEPAAAAAPPVESVRLPNGAAGLDIKSMFKVTDLEISLAKQAWAWAGVKRPFPVEDVDLMDVIKSPTGIKGWANSYDWAMLHARQKKPELLPRYSPADYETALLHGQYEKHAELVLPLCSGDPAAPTADVRALFSYARVLEDGRGVEADAEKCETLAQAAMPRLVEMAVAGDHAAQFCCGEAHYNELGAPDKPRIAKMWFRSAAYGGHPEALAMAETFNLDMTIDGYDKS